MLSFFAAQGAELSLTWTDNSINESGFRVERRTGLGSVFVLVGTTPADVTTFSDSTLTPGQEYWYRVCAYNEFGESDYAYSAAIMIEPQAPTLSRIENFSLEMNQSTGALAFVVADVDTAVSSLQVFVSSSDPSLLPTSSFILEGAGGSRSLTVVPAAGRTGSATITLTVFDGLLSTSESFSIEVIPPVPVPVIGALANITLGLNQGTGPIGFSVFDEKVDASALAVTATSSNTELLPNNRITLSGQGASRWFALNPVQNVSGKSTVTLIVSNGVKTSQRSFVLTVTAPVASPPSTPVQQPSSNPLPASPIGPRSYFTPAAAAGAQSNRVALLVDAGQSATLLAVGPDIVGGVAVTTFSLPLDGNFTTQVDGAGTLSVSVSSTSATVYATTGGVVMGGSPDSVAGTTSPRAGLYSSPLCFSSDGRIDVLAGQGGRALVAVRLDGAVASALGDIQPDGLLAVQLSNGGVVSLALNEQGGLAGTATIGGKVYPVMGGRSGGTAQASLVNLSVRSNVMTGAGSMVLGFVVSGNGSKSLLIRAIGPTLSMFGVPNYLKDPKIEVRRAGVPASEAVVGINDNWQPISVPAGSTAQGAFPLPANSLDAALLLPISAGAYTVETTDSASGAGVALVELYDADNLSLASTAKLSNLSVRTHIGTGDEVVIVGFMVSGTSPKRLLVRGVGPELSLFGLSGVLSDPHLSLFEVTSDGSRLVKEADDLSSADGDIVAAAGKVGAFPLAETSRSSALAVWLAPGVYTAMVRSGSGAPGIGLVELYDIP